MRPVLLATCTALPDGDEDAAALVAAIGRRGGDARVAVWDDPDLDTDGALVVLRSTWDYHERRAEFLDWVGRNRDVHNPAPVVAWNTDKTYLADLAAAGVPTVDSAFFPVGTPVVLPDPAVTPEIVVKPSVGAGSRGAGRFRTTDAAAALAHARDLQDAGRTVLVQPFLDGVDTAGETALLHIEGRFSHAIRKGPMLVADSAHPVHGDSVYVEENITARTPDPAELAVGAAALEVVRQRFGLVPLYARVDLLPSPAGPVVTELELTEPSMFLSYDPDGAAADRFAAAIAARA